MCSLHCLLKDTAKQYNTFLHHPLVCFECYLCSLQCPAKKQQTSVIHFYITLWCVLKAFVFLALRGKEMADQCETFFHHLLVCLNVVCFDKTLGCVLNAVCVPYTVL